MGQHAGLVRHCFLKSLLPCGLTSHDCSWCMLKYPIPKEKRIRLAKLYYHICTTPGMPTHIISTCSDNLQTFTRSKKKLSVEDMRLPWKPILGILSKDLFLTRRQYELRCVTGKP